MSKEKIRPKFKVFVEKWVESSAEQHCEAWKDRYWKKTKSEIEIDLYCNHDDTLEIEFVEETFKGATDDEIEFYLERFRKECLKYLGHRED